MNGAPDLAALRRCPDGPVLEEVARAVREAGGHSYVVGGWVRDQLLGIPSVDLDLEIHGLEPAEVAALLARFGPVIEVGRAFGVFRIKGVDVDWTLPRGDSLATASAGAPPRALGDIHMGFAEAARRRDLTVNAMGFDPLEGRLHDPLGGRRDLQDRRLRAADPARFGDDPLRALRVAQLGARLGMRADGELIALCAALDLGSLAGERVLGEWRKLLARAARPSLGLEFLERAGLLRFWPEIEDLIGVPQDPDWHPEGDVWVHTMLVVDAAVALRTGDSTADEVLGFAALAHDFGKPATTRRERGRVRSPGHDESGVPLAIRFLERMRAPGELTERVAALVRHHLAPALFVGQGAGARAYRRLARRLAEAGEDAIMLERVARADHLGRTTEDARAGRFEAGEAFLEAMRALEVERAPRPSVVRGRHLVARGVEPGPAFGEILRACRERQDETGEDDPGAILDAVLAERGAT